MSKYAQKAFTLLEISIVFVVIGLIMGATFAGVNLLQSAETRTILSEVQKLQESLGQFQSLYRGMPGDITNATSYWSASANGNGDGKIDAESTTYAASSEVFAALYQLSQSNLLEGSYAGFTGTAGSGFTLATESGTGNVLGTKGRKTAALYIKCCSGGSAVGNFDYSRTLTLNNYINLFSIHSTTTKRAGVLTPVEASYIDQKVDDGVPDTGMVGASGDYNGTAYAATGCYRSTGSSSLYERDSATYKNTQGCQMQFGYDWN